MALFQPTNIIPSSFTVGVVDAAKDSAQVSWQVNGNSAMTKYLINFYHEENQKLVLVGTTGKQNQGIPSGGFYGADRFGQPRMFTWENINKWQDVIQNGKNGERYQLSITQYWEEQGEEKYVAQIENVVFETKATPEVTIYRSNSDFSQKAELTDTFASSIGYFVAEYSQEQGDTVRWVRWQVATVDTDTNEINEIIYDTGDINTPTLQFDYNGFFNNQRYAIRCLIESESGQQAQNTKSTNDNWVFFDVKIASAGTYYGNFTLRRVATENAVLLEWTNNVLLPTVSGRNGSSGRIIESIGSATVWQYTTVRWEPQTAFSAPWTFAIEVNLTDGLIVGRGNWINGDIATIGMSNGTAIRIYARQLLGDDGAVLRADFGDTNILNCALNTQARKATVVISHALIVVYAQGSIQDSYDISRFTQGAIKFISLSPNESTITYRCVTVYRGDIGTSLMNSLYSDPDFKPTWYDSQYYLYMSANFNGNLNGGQDDKLCIYRQEVGTNTLFPIFYSTESVVTQLKDYGIVSRKSYTYWLYKYDRNDAFLAGVQCTAPNSETKAIYATNFQNYSLMVCDYDGSNDTYRMRKQYIFALNYSEGSVGNNNSPTLNANYTPYPTRMPSSQNYASGTLQGLIGAIYTVPALVEQIGGHARIGRPSTLDYFDSVDLEKEIKDLSLTPYTLFLRDTKGHLRMVATNNQITSTPDLKKRQVPISISLPWVEIGDASDVSIIQTPADYGWDYEEQSIAARMAVDPATGTLSARYPKPYSGIRFYLSGLTKLPQK